MSVAALTPTRLAHAVKLVIWDLDDTFWRGTLSEGAVAIPAVNVELVKTLARRGVVSSICSKNVHDDVVEELTACGVWNFFVFPRIAFEAKGAAVAAIVEQANLRPQNVLFIDDNPLNLAAAKQAAPGLMTADPDEILPDLLGLEQTRGKDDAELTRLAHYKTLEKRVVAQTAATGSAEAFLRTSGIEVAIDFDVEAQFDRVVELIDRSNQLNFTKKRLETEAEVQAFRASLREFGAHAGVVHVKDAYGAYGLAGVFLLFNRAGGNRLVHFVFSCRIMNMGVEQFIYERLNRPAIEVVGPVAYGLDAFARVDWITVQEGGTDEVVAPGGKLTLLGGCDLLQVASYCSADRAEYVNHMHDGVITHYDDAGFVLSPRTAVERSDVLAAIPCWTREDALRFDADLATSKTVVVSLWDAMLGQYLVTDDGVLVRLDAGDHGLQDHLKAHPDAGFAARCRFLELPLGRKGALIEACLQRIADLSPGATCRIVLGRNLTGIASGAYLRRFYNTVCRRYTRETGLFHFLDLDAVLEPQDVIDGAHLTRMGYHRIASAVRRLLETPHDDTPPRSTRRSGAVDADVTALVRQAWFRRSGAPLGPTPGRIVGWAHRARPARVAAHLREAPAALTRLARKLTKSARPPLPSAASMREGEDRNVRLTTPAPGCGLPRSGDP